MQKTIPYEIHITVSEVNNQKFIESCKRLNVKPIILELQKKNKTLKDVMTSSVYMGDDISVFSEMKRIKQGLIDDGLNVIREKVETVPWHIKAPSKENNNFMMPKNSYFETHLAVEIRTQTDEKLLQLFCNKENLHLSKNYFKKTKKGHVIMATYRSYDTYREKFVSKSEKFKKDLENLKLSVDKLIVEFAMFDTNVTHDNEWLMDS